MSLWILHMVRRPLVIFNAANPGGAWSCVYMCCMCCVVSEVSFLSSQCAIHIFHVSYKLNRIEDTSINKKPFVNLFMYVYCTSETTSIGTSVGSGEVRRLKNCLCLH